MTTFLSVDAQGHRCWKCQKTFVGRSSKLYITSELVEDQLYNYGMLDYLIDPGQR